MRRLALLAALVLPAPAAGADAGFLAAPTDQLAVPGITAGAEVTPSGSIYTGSAEVRFRFGPDLRAWYVPTRRLTGGRYPILRSHATAGGVRYAMTTLMTAVGGVPEVFVHVRATNPGRRAATARWRAESAAAFGAKFRFPRPATPSVPGLYVQVGAPFRRGVAYARGDTDARARLAPGASTSFDVRVPAAPEAPAADPSYRERYADAMATWRSQLAPAAALELPEPAVRDAYYASLVHILEPRYVLADGRWVQAVNKLQYHSFWLRDAAIMAQALDLAGLRKAAEQDLAFFASWQRPDGLFVSRASQYDGIGQALWGLGEHVRLTGDATAARTWLPQVESAMAWIARAREADPLGLIPASDPGDNELIAGHLSGDDFWAIAGADAAATLADTAGRPDLAASFRTQREALRRAVLARLPAGRRIPPALDRSGGRDWGNLWAAWPYPALAPGDARVTATLRRARARFAEGIATYGRSLHGYLGFRVLQTELARGAQRPVVDGLYASLAHLTATQGCFELGTRPYGRRLISGDLAPHGWCAAEIVALIRNMLVRERGGGIQLLAAVSPAWLGGGRTIALRDAPTTGGARVSVSLTSTRRGATLRWSAPADRPVWWTVPAGARHVRLDGRAVTGPLVALPVRSGTARIRWTLTPDARSLARTKRALAAAYRRHGRTPPF